MTMQAHERVTFRGKRYGCPTEPLEQLFQVRGLDRPAFAEMSTACYRGYIGGWEVEDDLLFLTSMEWGTVDGRPFGMRGLFPTAPTDCVFADWVTDWIGLYGDDEAKPPATHDFMLAVHCGRVVAVHSFRILDRPELYEFMFHKQELPPVHHRQLTPQLDEVFPEEASFVRALHTNWADRLPRLVYADWLEERSDPRGELLRVDVELAKSPRDDALLARRTCVLETVKDWFWMKLVGCDLPRNDWGWEQRTW